MKEAFALFRDDKQGPLWREFFDDLEDARRRGQQLAVAEGAEYFVFSLETNAEVARFLPRRANVSNERLDADV